MLFIILPLLFISPGSGEAKTVLLGQEDTTTVLLVGGKSKLITFEDKISRASITETDIADVVVVSPCEIVLNGKKPGTTTLIVWDMNEESTTFDLSVELDTAQLQQLINQLIPFEDIYIYPASDSVVLAGEVARETSIQKAMNLARAFVVNENKLVNLMKLQEPKQIMLQVRFAEVDRSIEKNLGIDFFIQDANYTRSSFIGGLLSPQVSATSTDFGISSSTDLLLEMRRGTNYTMAFKALEEKGLLRIIAEPNLLARSGEEASFLAGGEFPIPVVQGAGGTASNSVTIQFKEFGIKLNFTPEVTDAGSIKLKVAPEVSVLDFSSAAVQLSGFSVPGLVTRKADTTVEMASGESLIIGGLISQKETKGLDKVPILGEIPVLGWLFKSDSYQKEETELIVLVTPIFIKPVALNDLAEVASLHETPELIKPQKAPYRDAQADLMRGFIDPQSSIVRKTLDQVEEETAPYAPQSSQGYGYY